ncbi:MAG: hypothetical protein ABIS59_02465 [Candidatus Saccharibacteria bacterium]
MTATVDQLKARIMLVLIPIEAFACWFVAMNAYKDGFSNSERWGIVAGFFFAAMIVNIEITFEESLLPWWGYALFGFFGLANIPISVIGGLLAVQLSTGLIGTLATFAFLPDEPGKKSQSATNPEPNSAHSHESIT